MNEAHARDIADRLRKLSSAGTDVVELVGPAAREFAFVDDAVRRPTLIGSFQIGGVGTPFFVSLVVNESRSDDFQLFVIEKRRGSPVLMTRLREADALVWRYSAAKRTGDNGLRRQEFLRLAGEAAMRIPLPGPEVEPFAGTVRRAIELRHRADAAGGDAPAGVGRSPLEELRHWIPKANIAGVIGRFVASLHLAHSQNPQSWCVSRRRDKDLLRLNVGVTGVIDIRPTGLQLSVALEDLSDEERASLGARLDVSDDQRANVALLGENGTVSTPFGEADRLTPAVIVAHETFIQRAARSSSPFARYHNPEFLDALGELLGEDLPEPDQRNHPSAYWKLSPGEGGSAWPLFRDQRVIAIGWGELGDLSDVDDAEFRRRAAECRKEHGWGAGVDQAWKFRSIRPGDRIVANAGTSRVLGIGTVTGGYHYVHESEYAHRFPVVWDDLAERDVEMPGWRKTLIRLTADTFQHVSTAGPIMPPIPKPIALPGGGIDFEGVVAHLESQSLAFPEELVASYLLALQARRFVLLTGISGTGKTQLALEVARLFSPSPGMVPERPSSGVAIASQRYMRERGRVVVPVELAREFDALLDPETKRLDVEIVGGPRTDSSIYKDPQRAGLLYLIGSGELKRWFQELKDGDRLLMSRAVAKDGTERLVIQRLDASAGVAWEPAGACHELMAVRPDWTDSRGLLGFYNPLTAAYASTPALQLILRAIDEARRAVATNEAPRPYFLILDEMNLARVEHYFADFLSALSSGEPIHLHDDAALVTDDDAIPTRLTLPPNLVIVGTVNGDETTYMFSPKVLDRAFVLEFNSVNLGALSGASLSETSALTLPRMKDGLELPGKSTEDEWRRFETAAGGFPRRLLGQFHEVLEAENRHFGYRVAREIARFVTLAVDQTDGSERATLAAFDVAILAKLLPKLHGNQAELEGLLAALFAVAVGLDPEHERVVGLNGWAGRGEAFGSTEPTAPALPRTAAKLWRMRRRLRAVGYVSFIE